MKVWKRCLSDLGQAYWSYSGVGAFFPCFVFFPCTQVFFLIYQSRSLAYTSSCEFAQQREVAINKVVIKVSEKNGNSRRECRCVREKCALIQLQNLWLTVGVIISESWQFQYCLFARSWCEVQTYRRYLEDNSPWVPLLLFPPSYL